jgi:hypothetical protein
MYLGISGQVSEVLPQPAKPWRGAEFDPRCVAIHLVIMTASLSCSKLDEQYFGECVQVE